MYVDIIGISRSCRTFMGGHRGYSEAPQLNCNPAPTQHRTGVPTEAEPESQQSTVSFSCSVGSQSSVEVSDKQLSVRAIQSGTVL